MSIFIRHLSKLVLVILVSSCGSGGDGGGDDDNNPNTGTTPVLISTIGNKFKTNNTCDGKNASPQLSWSGFTDGTKSYAITINDQDTSGFVHWNIFNIHPSITSLAEYTSIIETPAGSVQVANDFGQQIYSGPCPTDGQHNYIIKVFALNVEDIGVDANMPLTADEFSSKYANNIIDSATINASYSRQELSAAEYHNIIRDALNKGKTLTNLTDENGSMDASYDFSLQPRPDPAIGVMDNNTALEESSADYAAQCIWGHSPDATAGNYGENLFSSENLAATLENAVNAWAYEATGYDYQTNTCTANSVFDSCGHYTQMVWDTATTVGCAQNICAPLKKTDGSVLANKVKLIVCHSLSPGNIIGQWPYSSGS